MTLQEPGDVLAGEFLLPQPVGLEELPLGRSRDEQGPGVEGRPDRPHAFGGRGCSKPCRLLGGDLGGAGKDQGGGFHGRSDEGTEANDAEAVYNAASPRPGSRWLRMEPLRRGKSTVRGRGRDDSRPDGLRFLACGRARSFLHPCASET